MPKPNKPRFRTHYAFVKHYGRAGANLPAQMLKESQQKGKPFHFIGIETAETSTGTRHIYEQLGDRERMSSAWTLRIRILKQALSDLLRGMDPGQSVFRNRITQLAHKYGIPIKYLEEYKLEELKAMKAIEGEMEKFKRDYLYAKTFVDEVKLVKEILERETLIHSIREKRIVELQERLFEEILRQHPELEKEPEIRMLGIMGVFHTSLYVRQRKQGVRATGRKESDRDLQIWTRTKQKAGLHEPVRVTLDEAAVLVADTQFSKFYRDNPKKWDQMLKRVTLGAIQQIDIAMKQGKINSRNPDETRRELERIILGE